MLRPGWLVLATNMLGVASAVDTPPDEAARLSRSVSDFRVKGKLSDAEKAAIELIAIRKNQHGPVHEEVLDAVLVRAVILADLGRMKECRAARHELVELHEKLRGKSHWSTVTARHELADAGTVLNPWRAFSALHGLVRGHAIRPLSRRGRREPHGPRPVCEGVFQTDGRSGAFEALVCQRRVGGGRPSVRGEAPPQDEHSS